MGYDLHISRAISWVDSAWFPITDTEILGLIQRHDDLLLSPPDGYSDLNDAGSVDLYFWCLPDDWLLFSGGEIRTKNPRPELVQRMVQLAADLDAWLTGDDGEVYTWDGRQVVHRARGPLEYRTERCIITRATETTMSWEAPIARDEWLALAAAQPDFEIGTSIEALLPSGSAWIACPPVAHWMDHPSGKPVPFLHDRDEVTANRDSATIRRAGVLATVLGARVIDENYRPLHAV
jgi:hypothetical protein